jgi:hypothetical protein
MSSDLCRKVVVLAPVLVVHTNYAKHDHILIPDNNEQSEELSPTDLHFSRSIFVGSTITKA